MEREIEKFSFDTIKNFDDHINKSIPNFDILMQEVKSLSQYFIAKDKNIYDLGCSTGKLLKSLDVDNPKYGYDIASLMPEIDMDVIFEKVDLNKGFSITRACLVYSIFTMQFLDREARARYLRTIYSGLEEGGALILCEKIYQDDGFLQEILSFSHYDYKCQHFSEKEIILKERDLRYIMKPNTESQNLNLLRKAGFSKITNFWQSYNFVGLIAIK